MYPSTENITNPARKLVAQLIKLVRIASLRKYVQKNSFSQIQKLSIPNIVAFQVS